MTHLSSIGDRGDQLPHHLVEELRVINSLSDHDKDQVLYFLLHKRFEEKHLGEMVTLLDNDENVYIYMFMNSVVTSKMPSSDNLSASGFHSAIS